MARLAGLPALVIARAHEILKNLEGGELDERGRVRLAQSARAEGPQPPAPADAQLGLFAAPHARAEREALDALRAADLERTTPLEALALLARLRAQLREETG